MMKSLSSLLIAVFLINTVFSDVTLARPAASTLAPLPASENPVLKREIIAAMYTAERLIIQANSPRRLALLGRFNAQALLLKSGKYLMTPQTMADALALIRAVTHEDHELLMQHEEKLHPGRYARLMRQIFCRKDILRLYRNLSHYKEPGKKPGRVILNDLIAIAFEIKFIEDKKLVYPDELKPAEKDFLALMRPILEAKTKGPNGRYVN
ncbi:MAG: hypothetical protein PHS37_09275, partial [Candidatus Omnitrophica bacterium]|nr:hypothetical protein [Candidatus Omnitrophota bacterium]